MNLGSIFTGVLLNMYGYLNPAYAEIASRLLFDETPERIPGLPELINLRHRDLMTGDLYDSYARQNGYNDYFQEALFRGTDQLLNPLDGITAWRRKIISEEVLDDIFTKNRYRPETSEIIKKITEYFPTPNDLVRFAVREVYTPDISERFGLKQDLPREFLDEAEKAGLQRDQAENYWAAHWELPSILQGFEMLHRGVIDQDTLNMLLKALDVMPYWREKLTQISYNPLTRVDVRRMFRLGVLDDEQVVKAYKDIGYNDENADLMLQFTKRFETESETTISRSTVVNAYKKDIIAVETLQEYLADLGYTADSISLIVAIADYEKYENYIDIVVDDIIARYRLGEITLDQARLAMNNLDLPTTYIDSVINKEKARGAQKTKLPTKTEIERWLKLNIIDEKEYKNYMTRQGYSDIDITRYLEEINLEVDTSRKKYLPLKTYQRWFTNDIISRSIFETILKEQDYIDKDIERLIREITDQKGG